MNTRTWLTVTAYLLWRTFQAMVVIPASVLGALWLFAVLTGEAPAHDLLKALYDIAETDVRPAAPGHVFQEQCLESERALGAPPPEPPGHVRCKALVRRQVPVDEAIGDTTRSLAAIYVVLLLCAFGGLLMLRPGRSFVGLSERETSPAPDAVERPAAAASRNAVRS